MDPLFRSADEKIECEISRAMGYRLLGWAIMSLWATALCIIFQVFDDAPDVVNRWLLWISPLMVIRGLAGVVIHNQLKGGLYFSPPLKSMKRMSMLFAISDGFLVLTALIISAGTGSATPAALVVGATAAIALLFLVYLFNPYAMAALVIVAAVPTLSIAVFFELTLPLGLLLAGVFILGGTSFGMLRFRRLFLRQLQENVNYETRIHHASESNYIFNEHWQKTPIAAIDWDQNLKIRSWNPAAERIFGFTVEEALGRPLELIFSTADAESVRRTWQCCQNDPQGSNVIASRQSLSKAGQIIIGDWYDTPLTLDDEIIGIASFVVAKDISAAAEDGQQSVRRASSDTATSWATPRLATE